MERDKTICDPASQEEGLGSVGPLASPSVPSPSLDTGSATPSGDVEYGRPIWRLVAELRDMADWIDRTRPQGLLYDSCRPALREAAEALAPVAGAVLVPAPVATELRCHIGDRRRTLWDDHLQHWLISAFGSAAKEGPHNAGEPREGALAPSHPNTSPITDREG